MTNIFKKSYFLYKNYGLKKTINIIQRKINPDKEYHDWIKNNEKIVADALKKEAATFSYKPKFSIIIPVYNAPKKFLEECIESILAQLYDNFELILVDDHSTNEDVLQVLEHYKKIDNRVNVIYRDDNGHISKATNTGLEKATGEFVALIDNDDIIPINALFEITKALNDDPSYDLIYTDEDKIDTNNRRFDPAFKPDWSPDLLLGTNYISHLGIYRRSILEKLGGFRSEYDGAQDYDLVLRFTEQTSNIKHIPKVLYHWRTLESSTASNPESKMYAFEAGKKALEDTLKRRNIDGQVNHGKQLGFYDLSYDILNEEKVSIIIPVKNHFEDTKRCLKSIIEKTTYPNFEIIIIDNGSTENEIFELYNEYKKILGDNFTQLNLNIPFNYSRLNNEAVKVAKGKYILFLNNDTEVISKQWLSEMVSFVQFDRVGIVGAKLYYPNDLIQHSGVVLGLGGIAGHPHHLLRAENDGYFGRLIVNVNYYAVTAACAMVKKEDFEAIGGFDENLAVAYNDVDLGIRLYNKGKDNIFLHNVELYHYESRTRGYEDSGEKLSRLEVESNYMRRKYKDIIDNDTFYSPNLSKNNGRFEINHEDK